jgi:hypothetical protein
MEVFLGIFASGKQRNTSTNIIMSLQIPKKEDIPISSRGRNRRNQYHKDNNDIIRIPPESSP